MLARGRAPLPGVASSLTTKEETTAILATISTTVKVSTACSREPVFASQSDVLARSRASLSSQVSLARGRPALPGHTARREEFFLVEHFWHDFCSILIGE